MKVISVADERDDVDTGFLCHDLSKDESGGWYRVRRLESTTLASRSKETVEDALGIVTDPSLIASRVSLAMSRSEADRGCLLI